MKYLVTTTTGIIYAKDANEAIEILNETENAIEAIKAKSNDDVYTNDREILATK